MDEKKLKNQQNAESNANAIMTAAEIASKTDNPYAKAIGEGVKAADKLTGGKSTELMGKTMNAYNKRNGLQGKVMQKAANKLNESGTTDRIRAAASKMNSSQSNNSKNGVNKSSKQKTSTGKNIKGSAVNKTTNSSSAMRETEEKSADGGSASFKISFKVKLAVGFIVFASVIMIFCVLLTGASQIFLNMFTLGAADSVSQSEADKKIGEADSSEFDKEIKDENVTTYNFEEKTFLVANTKKMPLYFADSKLNKINLIQINDEDKIEIKDKWREYNEADLSKLKEFYSGVASYSEKYDMDVVYKFFFKLYDIYHYYRNNYNLYLDMPLLMATLRAYDKNEIEVFEANSKGYSRKNTSDFDVNKDWTGTGYVSTQNESTHDVEIIAQNMISVIKIKESCVDSNGTVTKTNEIDANDENPKNMTCSSNETYQSEDILGVNEKKYREFLKEFLEKKYYSKEGYKAKKPNFEVEKIPQYNSTVATDSFAAEMVSVALKEYENRDKFNAGLKYSLAFGFEYRVEWCAAFIWYVSANTKYNGKSLYPDIIPFKSAGTGTYMRYFDESTLDHINFIYNDSCKNLTGKNGKNTTYTPKPGDYIFFDWEAEFSYRGDDTQDHTAMVEKFEDGVVYTIEGNTNDALSRRSYQVTDCRIVGYGSWY